MFSSVSGIISALVVFAILVFVHEAGHFIAAKCSGIPVYEFALGMGPIIFKKKKKETLYTVRLFPMGGFCRMNEDEEGDFAASPPYKRFLVLFSGAFLNLVLGFIVLFILSGSYKSISSPIVESILPYSNLAESGIKTGDKIVKLNNTRVNLFEDIAFFMEHSSSNEPINVTIKRGTEKISVYVTPTLREEKYTYYEDRVEVGVIVNGEVSSTETYPIENPDAYRQYIGQEGTIKRHILGFTPKQIEPSLFNIIKNSFYLTLFNAKQVYVSLYWLVTGRISSTQIMGPVGIIDILGNASRTDWRMLFELIALLTINLGIFNLLPLPALDGGRILFVVIEKLRGARIKPEKEGMVHFIGFLLLIGLMLVVTYNDIARLISGWFK